MSCLDMQNLNRATMDYLIRIIKGNMSLKEIRERCERYMLCNGADSFWYYGIGAFVFSGDETTISISGKNYQTPDRIIQEDDIITVDLSPQQNGFWGDFARTIIIQDGKAVDHLEKIKNQEWKNGLQMEEYLHQKLVEIAVPEMTFEELYYKINDLISKKGFVNLDFNGNLGHSIVKDKNDRIYIEKGNLCKLSQVDMFTFEPHISIPNSKYGYKREDIYFFKDGKLYRL